MQAMLGLTGMVIGIKTAFAAFFFGIFDMAHMRSAAPWLAGGSPCSPN
jgi:hypothetical protein